MNWTFFTNFRRFFDKKTSFLEDCLIADTLLVTFQNVSNNRAPYAAGAALKWSLNPQI